MTIVAFEALSDTGNVYVYMQIREINNITAPNLEIIEIGGLSFHF